MSRSVGRFAADLARLATAPLHPWRRAMAQAFAAQRLTPQWTIETPAGRLVFTGPSGRALHDAHGFNKDENVFDFYKRLEKFFAENLK